MTESPQFLIDANLPVQVFEALGSRCEAVPDFKWNDSQIWQYAMQKQLCIVTKDADFEHRVLQQTALRVIVLCVGNLRRRDLVQFLRRNWPEVRQLWEQTDKRLIKVFTDRIEAW